MVVHKFYRSGYSDVKFDLKKATYKLYNELIIDRVPNVGTRPAPLEITVTEVLVTGVLVKDAINSAEAKAFDIVNMVRFGASINLRIETDIVRTWEGICETLLFDILEARTEDIKFTLVFKIDDYP